MNTHVSRFAFFFLCLATTITFATPSFRTDRVYPNMGLKCRVIGGGEPEPLPQPKVYTYTFTRGTESVRKDLFDGHELWYASQHAGQWRDTAGNTFIIGRVVQKMPDLNTGEMKHVAREELDKALVAEANKIDPEKQEDLLAWVKAFTSAEPKEIEPLRVSSMGLAQAVFVHITEEKAPLVYLFRVKTRMPNGDAAKSDWYAAVMNIKDKTTLSKVRKEFEMQFLPSVSAVTRSTSQGSGSVQSRELSTKGRTAFPEHPSRDAAKKSIANSQGWWFAETAEYVFLSNIRSAVGKKIVHDLQKELPALRTACIKLIPPAEPISDVSVVRIFEDRDEYVKYVGKEHEWTSGLWWPAQRELVILSQSKDIGKTMEIIRHEAFHQYLFYASSMKEHAMWFDEGHASFLEEATPLRTGKGVDITETARVKYVIENLESVSLNLEKILNSSREAFYSGTKEELWANYATACSMVYFFRKGVPATKLTPYAKVMETYQATFMETGNPETATKKAFEGIDMKKFKADFIKFWKFGRATARKYNPA